MLPAAMLRLLQLASPALPVGAYTYSEGLETLVADGTIQTAAQLRMWLQQELDLGSVRLDGAIVTRAYQAMAAEDPEQLAYWNAWYHASRDTEELRQQSQQMGRSLSKLIQDVGSASAELRHPQERMREARTGLPHPFLENARTHFPIAYGVAAHAWEIPLEAAVLGYLMGWATNLVNAGIKVIPLGQTVGQQLLLDLGPTLSNTAATVLALPDEDLVICGWGLSLASMNHEVQYSRLFRS